MAKTIDVRHLKSHIHYPNEYSPGSVPSQLHSVILLQNLENAEAP